MAKVFLIDSENVGDSWIELMGNEDLSSSKFLVFYTGNSPRIQYEHAIQLMKLESKPEFIPCFEGSNALDFQLVSYLGYQLREEPEQEMIIVSNDTGFDAVVRFWSERSMDVKRLAVKDFNGSDVEKKEEPVSAGGITIPPAASESKQVNGVSVSELYTVVNCIGKKNLAFIHLAYTHLYGNEKGKELYRYMKNNGFAVPAVQWKPETKVRKFCELVFKHCNASGTAVPSDLYAYLYTAVGSNGDEKPIHKKLVQKYGEPAATELHKILKPFYKSIAKIK